MNLEARLAKYMQRDFLLEQAQTLVLMEEAAIAVFAALPEHFVMFGGATLVVPPPTIWSASATLNWNVVNPRGLYALGTADLNTD